MKNIFIKFIIISFIFISGIIYVFAAPITTIAKKEYQVPVLVYHSFGPATSVKESKQTVHYRITEKMFEEQMKYLSVNNYHPIGFTTYVNSLKNNTALPERAVVLTFDDGWKTQYQYAVPILEKYNFTASFFIITNYTNNNYKAYMNWDDLKYLVSRNFDIESHTKTHPILTRVDAKKLQTELVDSKKILEDKLGIKVTTLVYPNYMQNEKVRNMAKTTGYIGARAGWTAYKNSINSIYQLKSQEVVNNPNPFSSKRLPDLP